MTKTFYELDSDGQPCNYRQVEVLRIRVANGAEEILGTCNGKIVMLTGSPTPPVKIEEE